MRKLLILLLGAILIGILSYFCFMDKLGGIKSDLVTKANSAYTTNQMDWVHTGIKGDDLELTRILTLDGTAPTEALKAEAESIALGLKGVDGVDNRLVVQKVAEVEKAPPVVQESVVEAKPPVPSPYEIRVSKSQESEVVLSGYVPDAEAHSTVLDKAYELFSKDQVTDELKESEGAPEQWVGSAMLGLDKLSVVDYGKFKIVDDAFTFKGHVDEASKKEPLLQSFNDTLDSSYHGTYEIDAPEPKVEPTPEPEPVFSCQNAFKEILSSEKIHFEYNKADVKPESYKLLDSLVEVAKKCPEDAVSIEGHTDSVGSNRYNQKLSASRAEAVKSYLVDKGISDSRLKAVGYGELKPIADNKTDEGRATNRRIEFNVIDIKDVSTTEPIDDTNTSAISITSEPITQEKEKTVNFDAIPFAKLIKIDADNAASSKTVVEDVPKKETGVIVKSVWKRAYSCQQQFNDALEKEKIRFAYDKAIIKPESYSLLTHLSKIAQACTQKVIYIGGHTDSDGDEGYNKRLSQKRAEMIKAYFIKRGVSSDSLVAVGYGETRPVASNKTDSGKAKNRRIEFYVKGVK